MKRPIRRLSALALVLVLVAALTGCGDDDTDTAADTSSTSSTADPKVREDCSSALMEVPAPDPDLPAIVQETRADILEAALACDYDGLAEIATAGDGPFTVSFGGEDDPAAFWRRLEAEGRPVMETLVELLGMPWRENTADGTTQYVWPAAFGYDGWSDVPEGEREQLRDVYGDEELASFEQFGSYIGWRVGVTADGDWLFFVEGD